MAEVVGAGFVDASASPHCPAFPHDAGHEPESRNQQTTVAGFGISLSAAREFALTKIRRYEDTKIHIGYYGTLSRFLCHT